MDKIYTKGGDKGETSLFSGTRVSKADVLVNAYGTVDELNSQLGLAQALHAQDDQLASILSWLQHELLELGATLASGKPTEPRVGDEQVVRMEGWIDSLQEDMEPLGGFILPGGHPSAAALHVARTVCRRAERLSIEAYGSEHGQFDYVVIRFLNRLSDLLFVLAREANRAHGVADVKWEARS